VPEQQSRSDSRQRIIDTATALFVRDGYKATSIKSIAKDVGVSPPALYWHFPSKQDLFLACMEQLLTAFIDSVVQSVDAEDPVDRLRQFTTAHVRWQLDERESAGAYATTVGMRDLVRTLPAKHRRRLVDKQRGYLNFLREILDAGVAAGAFHIEDARVTGFAIITMCEYVHTWYDPTGELAPETVGTLYADLVVAMVGGGVPAKRPTSRRR